jgi:hypothetical protein
LRDPSTVNIGKLLGTIAVWLAYTLALALRVRGNLLAKRFAWTCLVLFGAAIVSIPLVDASRHPPKLSAPSNVVPR